MARKAVDPSGYVAPVQLSFQFDPIDTCEPSKPDDAILLGSGPPPKGWMPRADIMALVRLIDADLARGKHG